MKFTISDLKNGLEKNIISNDQYEQLLNLSKSNPDNNKVMNLLYYAGALLVISAMTWLMYNSWDIFGGGGIAILTTIYIVGMLLGAYYLYFIKKLITPGGLLFSIVICLIPLLMFGLLKHFEIWPQSTSYGDFYIWIKGKWVVLELSGIFVGLVILYFVRFPFILAPISFGLWFFSMDIVPIIFGTNYLTWTDRKHISLIFGTIMLIIGYFINRKSNKSFSFWLYLFGLLTLTASLSIYHNDEIGKFIIFFAVNLFFIGSYIILDQKVFLIFGTIGMTELLSRISYEFFKDSPLLPFILTFFGIGLILLGIFYQKNQAKLESKLKSIIPKAILNIKPPE
ncbi:DUF2157 domain-containing protein [Spirochaeta cellobiosiphila]|uniref:DUF2157 domain-containing protein n=1 Tax=Spirochaeta cellobiosiphila TaxID=504483 RepID=UPI00041309F5|nr:DUF2157 domain-containing protein [Spirochaeta cellobiosiphila]